MDLRAGVTYDGAVLKVTLMLFMCAFAAALVHQVLFGGGGGLVAAAKPESLPALPDKRGYSAAEPFEVLSPTQVEPRAARLTCRRCGSEVRVEPHQVQKVDGELLRVAVTRCKQSQHEDRVYFRLVLPA